MGNKFVGVLLRGYNNYDVKAASDEAGTGPGDEPSLTQQHFKDECDINNIMERFGLTGQLPTDLRAPMYGDFTGVSDYRSALHAVMAAEESFMRLDPAVRRRFDNDPQLFVDFCSDPRNIDAMREMGLAVPKKEIRNGEGQRGSGVVGVVGAERGGEVVAAGEGAGGDAAAAGGRDGGVGSGAAGGAGAGRR